MADCKLRCYNAVRAKAYGKELTTTDLIIFSRSKPLIHTEFQFSGRYGNISFSATMRDNAKGCRFENIDYNEHRERWDTLALPMTDEQEDAAYTRAKELNGKGYDIFGLLSFISDFDVIKPNNEKYWCSEACAELIKTAYGLGNDFIPDHFAPNDLFFEMFFRYSQ